MKINWGTAIVIAFILFAAFLTYFMIKSAQHPDTLVTDDYYNQEIAYQEHIENKARGKAMGNILLEPAEGKLAVVFPEGFNAGQATGEIHFYKPDNARIDSRYELSADAANRQLIAVDKMPRGLWQIKINAQLDDVGYYWEETINL